MRDCCYVAVMELDPYGIPERFFGPLSPELPALIGRVVMISALLETKVWHFTCSIANKVQEEYAAANVSENISLSKRRLALYQENDGEKKFASTTRDLLNDIEKALLTRNVIVHGVWPNSGQGEWMGWKPLLKNERKTHEWIEYHAFSRGDFIGLIAELVQLIERAEKVISEAGSIPRRADLR